MKTKIITLAVISFGILQSQAVSTINFDFGRLTLDNSITTLPDNSVVYMFVSTTGAATDLVALSSSLLGVNFGVGTIFGGDKVVIGASTTSGGFGGGVAENIAYTGGISPNDALGIIFFNQSTSTIASGTRFGVFTSSTALMPPDISNVTVDFLDVTSGGTIADGSLFTTTSVIPEPSAALLGAFGALGLLRRRRI